MFKMIWFDKHTHTPSVYIFIFNTQGSWKEDESELKTQAAEGHHTIIAMKCDRRQ